MEKTLIIKIVGGLGNQMFQYAFANSLSYDKSMNVKLDISWFSDIGEDTPRKFELNLFNKDIDFVKCSELWPITIGLKNSYFSRVVNFFIKSKYVVFNEPSLRYCSEVNNIEQDTFLNGFWQTEKYFIHNKDFIRELFSFPCITEENNIKIYNEIKCYDNSVSLHVRRGDYVSNENANSFHGVCSVDYYERAIKYIETKFNSVHLFIFSDDPDWVRRTFILDNITIISGNHGALAYRDMQLMTKCKHHILANSSFSWWGSWLSTQDGLTLAPSRWFVDESLDTQDLYCSGWLKIE